MQVLFAWQHHSTHNIHNFPLINARNLAIRTDRQHTNRFQSGKKWWAQLIRLTWNPGLFPAGFERESDPSWGILAETPRRWFAWPETVLELMYFPPSWLVRDRVYTECPDCAAIALTRPNLEKCYQQAEEGVRRETSAQWANSGEERSSLIICSNESILGTLSCLTVWQHGTVSEIIKPTGFVSKLLVETFLW